VRPKCPGPVFLSAGHPCRPVRRGSHGLRIPCLRASATYARYSVPLRMSPAERRSRKSSWAGKPAPKKLNVRMFTCPTIASVTEKRVSQASE
jgi:hypothetical protein